MANTTGGGPKTALEIAMERLRQKDAQEGVQQRPVTDAQKASIAEVRNFYGAKLAQEEVMHKSRLAQTADPGARLEIEMQYQRDREHLNTERDAKIERIRQQTA